MHGTEGHQCKPCYFPPGQCRQGNDCQQLSIRCSQVPLWQAVGWDRFLDIHDTWQYMLKVRTSTCVTNRRGRARPSGWSASMLGWDEMCVVQ
eukprot:824567-Amphidinium_carterae.1